MASTDLNRDLLSIPLKTRIVGQRLVLLDAVDSTNRYVLDRWSDGLVVVAEEQRAGRGTHGRSWDSQSGLGLWFSIGLSEPGEGLTFAAALAVRDALSERCPARVKWPNDILIGSRKVCGILVEQRNGRVALGIGINVHHKRVDFPAELTESAGSLTSETGEDWSRVEVLRSILTGLDAKVRLLREGRLETVWRDWRDACALIGREIAWGEMSGIVREIGTSGELIVETLTGVQCLTGGAIALVNGD